MGKCEGMDTSSIVSFHGIVIRSRILSLLAEDHDEEKERRDYK